MLKIENIESLNENCYYLLSPKQGLSPYLCGCYQIDSVNCKTKMFSVIGIIGNWRFDSFITIIDLEID
jgi:hypothetical protein